jgi:hypothetical protein
VSQVERGEVLRCLRIEVPRLTTAVARNSNDEGSGAEAGGAARGVPSGTRSETASGGVTGVLGRLSRFYGGYQHLQSVMVIG